MREDYKKAHAIALDTVRKAEKEGRSPYLPVLDSMEEVKQSVGQTSLGILELPLSRIKGNKEVARNNAFACDFMPLLEEDTEFAIKWSSLYDSYSTEGIRDAIKVYEYMNRYYVQEGNKRVSVANYGNTEFLAAEVIRILPKKTDTPEVKVYYEYLEFYKSTKNFLIVFSQPGYYKKLATLMGHELGEEWPEDLCRDLKSAYFRFTKCMKNKFPNLDEFVQSNAFLMYITIFPWKTLLEISDEMIIKNINRAKDDLLMSGKLDSSAFRDSAITGEKKQSSFWDFFIRPKEYTEKDPLRVGFVYEEEIDVSRWSDSHEAGRLYVDATLGERVKTSAYVVSGHDDMVDAVHHALHDNCDIVFTTCPSMLMTSLKTAISFPNTKLLNCSVGYNMPSLRFYQGKLYEGSFLMGILAADLKLQQCGGGGRIGYLSRLRESLRFVNLNAFAIGVSMIDPTCKVSLIREMPGDEKDYRKIWKEEGVTFYADFEYSMEGYVSRPGLYRMDGEEEDYLGTPYYNWGRFYTEIIHSVLTGSWDLRAEVDNKKPLNYWFGISSGMVDIRTKELPYTTLNLLNYMKQGIVNGVFSPFSGEIRTRDGRVIQSAGPKHNTELENMPPATIITMDWLNENVDGDM